MKILCLGNGDNLGVRTYMPLKENGHDVTLYRIVADEDPLRGNPMFYFSKKELYEDKNIHALDMDMLTIRNTSLFGSKLINDINQNYDIVIVSGGWHALIFSRKITIPKIFILVGYEVHTKAKEYRGIPKIKELFADFRQTLRNYFYGWLTRNALSRVSRILDWFPPTVAVNKSLGFEKKIIYMAFGENVKRNKSLVKRDSLQELNCSTDSAKRVFLWFSRINFLDSARANYKGANLFIEALEQQEDALSSGELIVYMSLHGEDKNEFKEFVEKSTVYKYIRWITHLDYPDLMTYLSIKNAVLFTDFGNVNSGISGIGRDGYAIGVPMVNSTTDEIMIKQYTVPGPRFYAFTVEEISYTMRKILTMSEEDFEDIKKLTAIYGEKYVDQSFFIKRLLDEASLLVNQ
jgi:hypothetical protein